MACLLLVVVRVIAALRVGCLGVVCVNRFYVSCSL